MSRRERVRRHPRAQRDIELQVDHYLLVARDPEVAERFVDAVERALDLLAGQPEAGTLCTFQAPELAGLRRWRVQGFREHLIFYRAFATGIDVLRVLHGARDLERVLGESPSAE